MSRLKERGIIFTAAILLFLMIGPLAAAAAEAPPLIPYRISGIITVNGRQITTDGEDYRLVVTRPDMTSFCPAAQDKDGITTDSPYYSIDIPVWSEDGQEGAKPDEPLLLHVYKNGTVLTVVSPVDGRLVMMPSGTFERLDIEVKTPSAPGDINDDGRIGLEEAIHALQVVAGIRQE